MRTNLWAAVVLAVGLTLASVLFGGIYEVHTASEGASFVWRVNRFTGSMQACSIAGAADASKVAPVCFDVPVKH
jgi:hypothetical protein